eukprot:scaffold25165_cov72-Cyclotella_meneghiniana.AAC.2
MGAAVEAGGEVQAELMGIALIALITSKEKYMVEDVWRKIHRIPRSKQQAIRQHDTASLLSAFNYAYHLDMSLKGLKEMNRSFDVLEKQTIAEAE